MMQSGPPPSPRKTASATDRFLQEFSAYRAGVQSVPQRAPRTTASPPTTPVHAPVHAPLLTPVNTPGHTPINASMVSPGHVPVPPARHPADAAWRACKNTHTPHTRIQNTHAYKHTKHVISCVILVLWFTCRILRAMFYRSFASVTLRRTTRPLPPSLLTHRPSRPHVPPGPRTRDRF